MTKSTPFSGITLLLALAISALGVFLTYTFVGQPDFASNMPVSLLRVGTFSCVVESMVFLLIALFSDKLSYGVSMPLVSMMVVAFIGFSFPRVSDEEALKTADTLARFAPQSTYIAPLRTRNTVGEMRTSNHTAHQIFRSPVKGTEVFKVLLGIQGASTHPEWQTRMESLTREGVIFDEDMRWMLQHLQAEARAGRTVNTQALAFLSER